jgi:hypothetical protein
MTRTIRSARVWPFIALTFACASANVTPPAPAQAAPDDGFADLVARLSEPGGFFPSANLVSNETSYLHVLGKMAELGVSGGAYVGVGPDQNFSYIAAVRPEIAFMIDIRRDNLLQHLLDKALFQRARNRLEYLCLLLGREAPSDLKKWEDATIEQIVEYLDRMPRVPAVFEASVARVRDDVLLFGIPLSDADLNTIRQIQGAFYDRGLEVRYSYSSRFPSWRQLLFETDLDGNLRNYLAAEESFRFVKEMERRNRIVPVTGDLGGPSALAGVGREIVARGLRISAFYVSNVEQYLMRGVAFESFAATVSGLPYDARSVMIRSYFGRFDNLPQHVPGHYSTQLLERVEDFVGELRAGGYRSYPELVTKNVLPLRG